MSAFPQSWASIHPSAYRHTAGPLRTTEAQMRPSGALRYPCPVNGSLVLVTDEATLAELDRPRARLRCLACGEMHLLTQTIEHDIEAGGEVVIPAPRAIVGAISKL